MVEQASEAVQQRADIEADLEQDRAKWAASAQVTLDHLVEQWEAVDNLVDAVALAGTATEYGRYAKDERKSADIWRRVAAAAFGLAFIVFVAMLLFGLGGHISTDTPWQLVVFKVTGSAGLLALGYYAGKESASHRKAERAAKSIQLDLAALEPFISKMSAEDKAAIRRGAAQRLFVPPTVHNDVEELDPSENA